jgi:predicted oxidoreductase
MSQKSDKKFERKLIYGCMNLGGGWNQNPISADDEKKAQIAVETALECGINTFDHADIYAFGKAEAVFGRILKHKPELREKIKIQSKAGIVLHGARGGSNFYNASAEYIENQVFNSLKNLNIEYLDMFLLHRPDVLTSFETVAEMFNNLGNKGLVLEFGVSNMSAAQLDLIRKNCEFPVSANQLQFSLNHTLLIDEAFFANKSTDFQPNSISGFLEYAQTHEIEIQAWSPLAKGLYSKFDENSGIAEVENTKQFLRELCEKYQTTPEAVLLAWLLKLPVRMSPIIGTVNPDRIRNCAKALSTELSHEDWYNLYITAKGRRLP